VPTTVYAGTVCERLGEAACWRIGRVWTLDLSVTDLRLCEADNKTVREELLGNLQRRIESGVPVIVSVGLARAFRAQGDTQSRHWLQVNNIHLEDDPVWSQG
jgi:hypothetical protein